MGGACFGNFSFSDISDETDLDKYIHMLKYKNRNSHSNKIYHKHFKKQRSYSYDLIEYTKYEQFQQAFTTDDNQLSKCLSIPYNEYVSTFNSTSNTTNANTISSLSIGNVTSIDNNLSNIKLTDTLKGLSIRETPFSNCKQFKHISNQNRLNLSFTSLNRTNSYILKILN